MLVVVESFDSEQHHVEAVGEFFGQRQWWCAGGDCGGGGMVGGVGVCEVAPGRCWCGFLVLCVVLVWELHGESDRVVGDGGVDATGGVRGDPVVEQHPEEQLSSG